MTLTTVQLQLIKSDILTNPDLSSKPANSDGSDAIAKLYNLPAVPTFTVWKSDVTVDEIMLNGFDWTRVDNLTVGKARIWEWITTLGHINPSQANVRAAVLACFSTAGDTANRQAVFTHSARPATRLERVFATGTGLAPTDQGVGPGQLVVEGIVTYQDIDAARAS